MHENNFGHHEYKPCTGCSLSPVGVFEAEKKTRKSASEVSVGVG